MILSSKSGNQAGGEHSAMQKEYLSSPQAICIIAASILGTSLLFGVSYSLGQDAWIPSVLVVAILIPVILIYARIIKLFPEKNLFEITEQLFGKFFGKILTVFFVFYALYLGGGVLRSFTDYIQTVSMPETPSLPVAIAIIAVVMYLEKSGIGTFGKFALVIFLTNVTSMVFANLYSFKFMDFSNIRPVMNVDFQRILAFTYAQFALPYDAIVLFLGIAGSRKKKDSPYKIYLYGILIATALTLIIVLRNLLVLGPAVIQNEWYPSYAAARVISLGDFFARIENLISVNYLLAGIIKLAICFLAASKGLTKIFNMQSYKQLIVPAGLLALPFSIVFARNAEQLFEFTSNAYLIYVIPVQLLIPLLIWIAAEIKARKKNTPNMEEGL